MAAFADASAVVKLYVPEAGSSLVRRRVDPLVIAALTRVEVVAAFWGRFRTGDLQAPDAQILTDAFEHDLANGSAGPGQSLTMLALGSDVLDRAARHTARHGLKAADAVQLASAQLARSADPTCTTFLVFDRRLARAASAEGFAVVGA